MNIEPASGDAARVLGSCLCGAVLFEIELPTRFCVHCHCSMCRRNHGAAFVTWFGVAKGQLRVLEGDSLLTRYRSSEQGCRSFCSRCGSSLFCELAADPETVDIPLASMRGPIDREPEAHVYYEDHVRWVDLEDGLPRIAMSDPADVDRST